MSGVAKRAFLEWGSDTGIKTVCQSVSPLRIVCDREDSIQTIKSSQVLLPGIHEANAAKNTGPAHGVGGLCECMRCSSRRLRGLGVRARALRV